MVNATSGTIVTARTVTDVGDASDSDTTKMIISSVDGTIVIVARYAPRTITYSNLARTWTPVPRPGLAPVLSVGEIPLKVIGFDLAIADLDPDVDVEDDLADLEKLAQSSARCVVSFGPSESGMWRFTSLSISSVQRHATTQAITQATATVEFTRLSDYRPQVGPVTGGSKPAPTAKASYYGGGTYTVKAGDTLGKISTHFYKTTAHWRLIADANKIRNPSAIPGGQTGPLKSTTRLRAGRKLTIPRVKR